MLFNHESVKAMGRLGPGWEFRLDGEILDPALVRSADTDTGEVTLMQYAEGSDISVTPRSDLRVAPYRMKARGGPVLDVRRGRVEAFYKGELVAASVAPSCPSAPYTARAEYCDPAAAWT